jgi:hypothetical protein
MKQALVGARRHACRQCGCRNARFAYRGTVRWDRFHELCFRCYRSVVDARKARALAAIPVWAARV